MEAYAKPMRELADTLSWFVRAQEIRLLYVAASAELRTTAVRLSTASELHAYNRSPFVLLEDAFTATNEGWLERVERLRAQHVTRKERMAAEGENLADLPPRPTHAEPFAMFGAQLAQNLAARASWQEGLVIVLAPTRVERAPLLCERVKALLFAKPLASVRWIVVDPDPPALSALAEHLGEHAIVARAQVDESEAQRELARVLDGIEHAPPDAVGPARVGAAWPQGVSPPPRRDRPTADPEAIEALLKEEGISMPLAGRRGTELSRATLRAAQAMRRNQTPKAIEEQSRARDICLEAGLLRESAIMQLVLGGYFVAASDTRMALATYADTSDFARKNGHRDLEAQAELARGALLLREGRRDDALLAYLEAAQAAEAAGQNVVAIEALRLAGQVRHDGGEDELAMKQWLKAIHIADRIDIVEARASCAAEVARGIAAICRKGGLVEDAKLFEDKSRTFEGG